MPLLITRICTSSLIIVTYRNARAFILSVITAYEVKLTALFQSLLLFTALTLNIFFFV